MKVKHSIFILCILLILSSLPLSAFAAETQSSAKLIAITFDDGPGKYTEKLLDGLAKRNVKATFFVLGSKAASYKTIIKREFDEGHQIASHSWDHPELTKISTTALTKQLNDTVKVLKDITGQSQYYLRPPYGSYNSTVKAYAGGPLILWSVDPLDWKYKNATTVKNNIVNNTKDGSIILVHDIHSTSVDGALAAIDVLLSKGYEFVTVSELLRRRGITPEMGVVYTSAPNKGINLPAQESSTPATPAAPVTPKVDDGGDYDESKLSQHWAYSSIQFVQNEGLMQGISENKFAPDKYITKAMFVTILSRMSQDDLSTYTTSSLSDVKAGAWYANAVEWAYQKEIITLNEKNEFDPNGFMDRETMCLFLDNYANYKNIYIPDYEQALPFTDTDQISALAKDAVQDLHGAGLIMGTGNNLFQPKGKSTRAQVAVLLNNFIVSFVDNVENQDKSQNQDQNQSQDQESSPNPQKSES